MSFQIVSLTPEPFAPLFALSDAELAAQNACRQMITEKPGAPCRVSLAEAEVGETVLLLNYEHQPGDSPYRARHAIYVREGVEAARPAAAEVPEIIRTRLISLRLFDRDHMIIDADVLEGAEISAALHKAFANPAVAYAHMHAAKRGCFLAAAQRPD